MYNSIKQKAKQLVICLKLANKKIAFAESISGGSMAKYIPDIPGSSAVFECSIVAYSSRIKQSVLKVNKKTIDSCGVVSEPVAAEMARGVSNLTNADIAVSCTGEAGPISSSGMPVGTVCAAVFYKGGLKTYTLNFDSQLTRDEIRQAVCEKLIDIALDALK